MNLAGFLGNSRGHLVKLHREQAGAPVATARHLGKLNEPVAKSVAQAHELGPDAVTEARQVGVTASQGCTDIGRQRHDYFFFRVTLTGAGCSTA